MARDLYGEMMGRALQRQAPQGHMPAYITQGEADILRSLGGGVGPAGGQIMRGGIPSFQRYKGTDDAVLDYVIPSQYQEAADRIEPAQAVSLAEQLAIETERQDKDRIERDLAADEQAQIDYEARLAAEQANTKSADYGGIENPARLVPGRTQSNIAGDFLPQGSPISQYEVQPPRFVDPLQTDFTLFGTPPGEHNINRMRGGLGLTTPTVREDMADLFGFQSLPSNVSSGSGGPISSNIVNVRNGDEVGANDPNNNENDPSFLQRAVGGVWDHPFVQGLRALTPIGALKEVWKGVSNLEPRDPGAINFDRYVRNVRDPNSLAFAKALGENLGYKDIDPADVRPSLQQQAQGHGGRTPWEFEQEAQQAEEEALAQVLLKDQTADDTDDTDGGPTPEEIAHQERVRKNIEGLSPEYRRRLGLEKAEIGIPEQPPWMPGFYPIGGPEGGIPGGIPEGFTAPMTHINPGDYPDTFINDSTGQIFTAPSLGYVPPAGWRRIDSRPQPDFTRVGGPVGRVPTLW
jgi:hypothetical protein